MRTKTTLNDTEAHQTPETSTRSTAQHDKSPTSPMPQNREE